MQNLQHLSDTRAWVVYRNSDPVVIAQTLKVDGATKRKFKCETRDKEGIESLCEMERHTKRLRHSTTGISSYKKIEYALALMGLLLTDIAKPNAEGSATRGGVGEAK